MEIQPTDITALGLAAGSFYLFYRFVTNHVAHNTEVITELKDAIRELTEWLRESR